jgi:hypothetical protein
VVHRGRNGGECGGGVRSEVDIREENHIISEDIILLWWGVNGGGGLREGFAAEKAKRAALLLFWWRLLLCSRLFFESQIDQINRFVSARSDANSSWRGGRVQDSALVEKREPIKKACKLRGPFAARRPLFEFLPVCLTIRMSLENTLKDDKRVGLWIWFVRENPGNSIVYVERFCGINSLLAKMPWKSHFHELLN